MVSNKLKSKRGISLPVAMAITTVLVILSASLIAIALSSITNTSSSVNSRQAYLNARSAIEYAAVYYTDEKSVPDPSKIVNEYMVMDDKEGGTTAQGGHFVSTEEEASEYATYVVANYIKPASSRDSGILKLKAYAKSSDAFGGRVHSVKLAASYSMKKLSSKNRITITDVDMTTDVQNMNVIRDAISLHCKQYPGQNWTPFYYIWTYKDEARMYELTKNCYGLESSYKNYLENAAQEYYYRANKDDPNSSLVKSSMKIPAAFNKNQSSKNKLEPAGVWNAVSYKQDDPRNGTVSYFAPGSGGWYDATYYIDKNQVNYFNMIITGKGKTLNGPNGEFRAENTQTNEMFHLWFLNNSDRNIYFEFLKPGMYYRSGSNWNGRESLDDRMLVYVKNKKTTVHFKIKGIGDGEEGLNPPTKAPTIGDISIRGTSIYDEAGSFKSFTDASLNNFYGSESLENKSSNDLASGIAGRTSGTEYFYGAGTTASGTMIYEGQGWWVANIATGKDFDLTIGYYDKAGNYLTDVVKVSPSSDDEAYVVVDLSRGTIQSYYKENRACAAIGLDIKSYSTVHVKSSEIGTAIAPYLDYYSQSVSTTGRRQLSEKIGECTAKYIKDDYEDATFEVLQKALQDATDLVNDDDYIKTNGAVKAEQDYVAMIERLDKAVAQLRTKFVDPTVYTQYTKLIQECEKLITEQSKEVIYDATVFAAFVAKGNPEEGIEKGAYTKAKDLDTSGAILENSEYTTSTVYDLIDELNTAKLEVEASRLDKQELKDLLDESADYRNDTRYKSEFREALKTAYLAAKDVYDNGPNQEAINAQVPLLKAAYEEVLSNPDVQIDTTELTNLLRNARTKANAQVNCTAESLKVLKDAIKTANSLYKNVSATQEMVDAEVVNLQAAIDQFEIIKPNGDSTANSITTDKLLANGKIRIWVKGLNKGTQINGFVNDNGAYQNFDNPRSVSMFILSTYLNGEETKYNSRNFTFIDSIGMGYIDVPASSFTSVTLNLTCTYNIMSEEVDPSTGNYTVLDTKVDSYPYENGQYCQVGNIVDGNLVICFDALHLKKIEKDNTSTYNDNNQAEAYNHSITLTKGKMTELFVDAPSRVTAEITNPDGTFNTVTSLQEGPYQVVRFVFATSESKNQSVTLRYYDIETGENYVSAPFDSQIGQFVVRLDKSTKQALPYYQVRFPYNSANILKAQVSSIWAVLNENDNGRQKKAVSVEDDGKQYVLSVPFTGTDSVTLYRDYHDYKMVEGEFVIDENSLHRIKNTTINVAEAKGVIATYDASDDSVCTYSYDANALPEAFFQETAKLINVKTIYPLYQSNSGSSSRSTGSSAYTLDGIVSTTFADELLTTPLVASATTQATAPFDYFGQSGVNSYPTKNIGSTVIWIDCSGSTLKKVVEGGNRPVVYAWDSNKRDLNGAWPGREAMRIEDSDIYYVVVAADCRGIIITDKNKKKVGGNPSDSNNIYIDLTDTWLGSSFTQWYAGANRSGFSRNQPGKCRVGNGTQGHCCLYTIIDDEVVNGTLHSQSQFTTQYNSKKGKLTKYTSYYITNAPGYNNRNNVVTYSYNNDIGGYNLYYRYRAKRSDEPQMYTYTQADIDSSQMTAKDKRMAFVGGSKIRMQNMSYFESYGTIYYTGQQSVKSDFYSEENVNNSKTQITYDNLYGGAGGNQQSMGRVGDCFMTLMYDWFEYKIPVDQSDTYTFQVKGLRYVPTTVGDKKWYEDGYQTDTMYAQQVHDVYGNVWLVMNDIVPTNGIFEHMTLYTQDPETIQVEDNQPIYFKLTGDETKVEVKASGVGGSQVYTMESYSSSMLKTTVPAKTPFLVITATYSDGTAKTFRTSLQGNDLVLFDASLNLGKGGWNNYVPDNIRVERELYVAQGLYYGSVLVRSYNDQGKAINLGNNNGKGSYKYASGIWNNVLNGKFDGEGHVNSSGYALTYSYVHSYTSAYTELYATMAQARAYLPEHNYPEFIHGGKPDIYDTKSIEALQRTYNDAEGVYENGSLNDVINMNKTLKAAIDNIAVSTSDRIPIIFYDSQKIAKKGASFTFNYSETKNGVIKNKKVEYFNTEGCPIIFIQPLAGEEAIYNLQFTVTAADGSVTNGIVKDEVPLTDGAWVYVHQPAILPDRPTDTSYWVQNTAADYRQISNTSYTQVGNDSWVFDMVAKRDSISSAVPVAYSTADVKTMSYRPLTLYFKYDCDITCAESANNYTIRAGAYTFDESFIIGHQDAKGDAGPLTIVDTGNGTYVPRIDLCSSLAKTYFTQKGNYGEYTDANAVDASSLSNWVTPSVDGASVITAGSHGSAKTVNMTANSGSFAGKDTSYILNGNFYFRWMGNQNLEVYNDVNIKASEFTFATSGIVDATANYGKHIYIGTRDDQDKMDINFITDVRVMYYDKYGDLHDFTIREGAYEISRPQGQTDYIADLCDEDYWESMLYITVKARYEADGGSMQGGSGNGRFGEPVFTND